MSLPCSHARSPVSQICSVIDHAQSRPRDPSLPVSSSLKSHGHSQNFQAVTRSRGNFQAVTRSQYRHSTVTVDADVTISLVTCIHGGVPKAIFNLGGGVWHGMRVQSHTLIIIIVRGHFPPGEIASLVKPLSSLVPGVPMAPGSLPFAYSV